MAKLKTKVAASLVDVLLDSSLLTREQAAEAVEKQRQTGRRMEDLLIEEKLIQPEQLGLVQSMRLGVPFVNLKKHEVDPKAVELVPEAICRQYNVVPLQVQDGTVVLAMEDPGNIDTIDTIAAQTKRSIEPVLALHQDILEAIDINYRVSGEIEQQLRQIPSSAVGSTDQGDEGVSAEAIAQAPVVRIVDLLIRQAARDRASDIHVEPQLTGVRVRFRIDGILHEIMNLPTNIHSALISRIKIMAGMNIAERRRPQDGQISFKEGERTLDIRVATVNTVNGEMAVLRLLDKTFAFLTMPQLGFLPESQEKYRLMLKTPFGMILISGPTGAGKTTTLYASVNQLDSIGRNIITIEDPVEYHFANINQIQVNAQAGLTFAAGLRSCMRLDPNIILVGEIRDKETAQIAVQAALTGHLVLSSVHANDSVGVIYRLMDLGVEPFLVASALIGIVAQRMVRRICSNCAHLTAVSPEERLSYERELSEQRTQFLYGDGCGLCGQTGYLGRTGIYEVLVMTEGVRRLVLESAGPDAIKGQALKDGLFTLWRDGMMKVKAGLTTPYEVIRNVFSIH
ncbi:MAG: type II/IV secretion system protein [Chloroflexi bacterium]|nr:type II/IV secretion system protein [Chloroflexota bacterium]